MRIFDCTLRDGGNVVGCGFSQELTDSMIRGLLDCGIQDIEMGNAKGIGSYDRGANAPLDDAGYAKLAAKYAGQGRLGMFMLASLADEEKVHMVKENGLDFIRVGIAAGDGEKAVSAVEMVKKAGLTCRYSMMKAYVCTPEDLAQEAQMLGESGVDIITIMDSAGTMYPQEVRTYVSALKARAGIPVGFHGHSNLGLSQANALAAAQAGADEIDGGLLGMARSAGNCATELAVATLTRDGYLKDVDLYALLRYEDEKLIPAMQQLGYRPAVTPEDLILGLSGCHSAFLNMFHKVAKEECVDLYQLIVRVSAVDRKAPTEELLHRVAADMRGEK